VELLDRETLQRKDLARIFNRVEKRPRITEFNDFGGRTPSDKPPVKTRGELAKERGEPWPPVEDAKPTPVGTVPAPVPGQLNSNGGTTNGVGAHGTAPNGQSQPGYGPNGGQAPNGGTSAGGPPYYGAPPGWSPATTPQGQPWTPAWERPAGGAQDAVPGSPDDDQSRHPVDTDDRDNGH
jgi:cell division protease FtsH